MVFNSVIFIFCFLPIFLLIYYLVPTRFRNPVLLAGSLFFYAWGDPTYLILMIFSSFFNYYMGKELGDTQRKGFIPEEKSDFCHCDQPSDPRIFQILGDFFWIPLTGSQDLALLIRNLPFPSAFPFILSKICLISWIFTWERHSPAKAFISLQCTAPCSPI